MTDDEFWEKVANILRRLGSGSDAELITSLRGLQRFLASAGTDVHEIAERLIKGGPLTEEELLKVYQEGQRDGLAMGSRKPAITAPKPTVSLFDNDDDGVNGHSWMELAESFVRNLHRLNDYEERFAQDMIEKLPYWGRPTEKQANLFRRIFMQRFGGKLV